MTWRRLKLHFVSLGSIVNPRCREEGKHMKVRLMLFIAGALAMGVASMAGYVGRSFGLR
jgi:hypothetical protein